MASQTVKEALIGAPFGIFYMWVAYDAFSSGYTQFGIMSDSLCLSWEILVEFFWIQGTIHLTNKIWFYPHYFCTFFVIFYGNNKDCDEIGLICNLATSVVNRILAYGVYFGVFTLLHCIYLLPNIQNRLTKIGGNNNEYIQHGMKHLAWLYVPIIMYYNYDSRSWWLWVIWAISGFIIPLAYYKKSLKESKSRPYHLMYLGTILSIIFSLIDIKLYLAQWQVNLLSFLLLFGAYHHIMYYDFCQKYDYQGYKCHWIKHKCLLQNSYCTFANGFCFFKTLFDVITLQACTFEHPLGFIVVSLEYSCVGMSIYQTDIITMGSNDDNNSLIMTQWVILFMFVFAGFILDSWHDAKKRIIDCNNNCFRLRDEYLVKYNQFPETMVILASIVIISIIYVVLNVKYEDYLVLVIMLMIQILIALICQKLYKIIKLKSTKMGFAYGKNIYEAATLMVLICTFPFGYSLMSKVSINYNTHWYQLLCWILSIFCRVVASDIAMDCLDIEMDKKENYATIAAKYGIKTSQKIAGSLFILSFALGISAFEVYLNLYVLAPLFAGLITFYSMSEYIHLYELYVVLQVVQFYKMC